MKVTSNICARPRVRRRRRHSSTLAGMFVDRWSLVVIRDMMFSDRRHFGTILKGTPEGIASNTLADRLKHLLEDGLVTRTADPNDKRKIIYSLTEPSIQLVPILIEMGAWERQHCADAKERFDDGSPCMWDSEQRQIFMDRLRERHLAEVTVSSVANPLGGVNVGA